MTRHETIPAPISTSPDRDKQIFVQPAILKLLQVAHKNDMAPVTFDAIRHALGTGKSATKTAIRHLRAAGLIHNTTPTRATYAKWALTDTGHNTTPAQRAAQMRRQADKNHARAMQEKEKRFTTRAATLRAALREHDRMGTDALAAIVRLNPSTTREILREMAARKMIRCHAAGPRKHEWSL